jgi:ABC-type phosphate transport system ATPase subunit
LNIEELAQAELYRYFLKIDYHILNQDGFEVSGGERSEFRLLQEIQDANNYELLLIDEPESSFDNLFLNGRVNEILRTIANKIPVVVVTHNNTVGASIGSDYIIYAKKELSNGTVNYHLYSGRPSDKLLTTTDGKTIESHSVVMNSLEAGHTTYLDRKKRYENIENRK